MTSSEGFESALQGLIAEETTPARAAVRVRRAARQLFTAKGVQAVGVQEIVDQAGITKPSLYRAFASKNDLAVAWLEDEATDFWVRFEAILDSHPSDLRAGLVAVFEDLAARAQAMSYRGCAASNAVLEFPNEIHPIHIAARGFKLRLRERLTQLVGELGVVDRAATAGALLLVFEGIGVSAQVMATDDLAQSVTLVVALILTPCDPARSPASFLEAKTFRAEGGT